MNPLFHYYLTHKEWKQKKYFPYYYSTFLFMLTRINLHSLFLCVSTSAVPSNKFYFRNYTFRLRYIRAQGTERLARLNLCSVIS
jgi:hypothetical protein